MENFLQHERRQNARFKVAFTAKIIHSKGAEELTCSSRDISANGFGLVLEKPLMCGEVVEATFIMPDNSEKIETRGIIIRMHLTKDKYYNAGISITDQKLRPIPMVLRSIRGRKNRH